MVFMGLSETVRLSLSLIITISVLMSVGVANRPHSERSEFVNLMSGNFSLEEHFGSLS